MQREKSQIKGELLELENSVEIMYVQFTSSII